MGFKSVYRTLQELFPQVDARLLKAAAIEHPKDPDGAVEFILTEVIPSTIEKIDTASVFDRILGSSDHPSFNERVEDPSGSIFYDAKDFNEQLTGYAGSKTFSKSKTLDETHQNISVFPVNGDICDGDCSPEPKNSNFGEPSARQEYRDLDPLTLTLSALSTSSVITDTVSDISLKNKSSDNSGSDCEPLSVNSSLAVHTEKSESQKKQPNFDSDVLYESDCMELTSLSVEDHPLESLNFSIQSNVESITSESKLDISELACTVDTACREDLQVLDNANTEESSGLQSIVTQSRQVCNIDLLGSIIQESKGHKTILLSDMESVLKLMKEVEYQEKAAEQAKKKAADEGGLEIRAKVDELKSMLNRAKETNDMHSGEVYGERAILSTEMKELQSRLVALSDMKEKSLSILDVMRKTLEARLATAEMERIAAEQETYKSGESDRKALAEQEYIMEQVVQESKILQQVAEENARLQEFLMDRGRVVDMLQGEISVICQDVKSLKEKLDWRVPLSQSQSISCSSEQTSCILASAAPDSITDEPVLLPSAEQTTAIITQKELLDDEGWELFEDVAQD